MPKKTILLHVIPWVILYLLWVFLFQNHSFTIQRTLTVEFCYLFFIVLDYYLIIFLLIPRWYHKKRYLTLFLGILTLIFFSSLLRTYVAQFMNSHFYLVGRIQ